MLPAPQVSARYMVAVFGTPYGVPVLCIPPADQPEHSPPPSLGHDGGGFI